MYRRVLCEVLHLLIMPRNESTEPHCHRQKPSTQINYSSWRDLLPTLPSDPFASSLVRRVLPWFETGPILVVTVWLRETTAYH